MFLCKVKNPIKLFQAHSSTPQQARLELENYPNPPQNHNASWTETCMPLPVNTIYLASRKPRLFRKHVFVGILRIAAKLQQITLNMNPCAKYRVDSAIQLCVMLTSIVSPYGWRKCSKSQARRTETALSGSPLCGLQALCWIIPNCCKARCCRSWWSTNLSLEPSTFPPEQSSSPKLLLVALICAEMASFRHLNCFEMVCKAKAVYDFADPCPAACSNEETTICICWWYCLYLCSTFQFIRNKLNQYRTETIILLIPWKEN